MTLELKEYTPKLTESKLKDTLYRIDSKGKVRQWEIAVKLNEDDTADKITRTGLKDGKLITSVITIKTGKNIGKINATTPIEQALQEAEADYTQALRKGYVTDITSATQGVSGSGNLKPMLAQKYDPTMQQKDSKNLDKLKMVGERGFLQPKKDGNRCNAVVTNGAVKLITRKGDAFLPIPLVEANLAALPFDFNSRLTYVIDGELMSPEMTFNQLNGLLKKQDKSPEQIRLLNTVKLHVYDVMLPIGYGKRYEVLEAAFGVNPAVEYPNLELIENVPVILTPEIIDHYLELWLEQEEEGLMIRRDNMPYEHKRTWQLMKYKTFEDAEFEVIDLEADSKGNLGAFYCKPNSDLFDRDGKAITSFKAGTKGITHEEGRKMLENKEEYIGKIATVRYQMVSEFGVPRFPKLVGFRSDV